MKPETGAVPRNEPTDVDQMASAVEEPMLLSLVKPGLGRSYLLTLT